MTVNAEEKKYITLRLFSENWKDAAKEQEKRATYYI